MSLAFSLASLARMGKTGFPGWGWGIPPDPPGSLRSGLCLSSCLITFVCEVPRTKRLLSITQYCSFFYLYSCYSIHLDWNYYLWVPGPWRCVAQLTKWNTDGLWIYFWLWKFAYVEYAVDVIYSLWALDCHLCSGNVLSRDAKEIRQENPQVKARAKRPRGPRGCPPRKLDFLPASEAREREGKA